MKKNVNLSRYRVKSFVSALLFLLMFLSACGNKTVNIAIETAKVRERSRLVTTGEETKNIPEIMKYYAKDAIVQFADRPQLQGIDAIEKSYKEWYSDTVMRLKSFTSTSVDSHNITVAASGDIAYDYGINKMIFAGTKGDLLSLGKYLLVWKKIDGEWYIVAISATGDSPSLITVNTPK